MCLCWLCALMATAQEEDFDLPGEDGELEDVELLADSVELTEEDLLDRLSPDERWLYVLRKRLNQT